jgi:predicted SAM-dependent methyltransferase
MKLHLGCGERHLPGYINIDYCPDEHTVQTRSVADEHADILSLRYGAGSVEEIRLHHVFEHFTRPVACALLTCWRQWLNEGGRLHIETPDFERSARLALNPFAGPGRKAVALRHIFGSHEAPWAVHCQGYDAKLLRRLLRHFGFRVEELRRNRWRGTHNIEALAVKEPRPDGRRDLLGLSRAWLEQDLIDDSEEALLEVWLAAYREQVDRCWPEDLKA